MNKRTFLNLGLLLVIAALALLAWFKPGLKTPPAQPALVALETADIHEIQIQRRDTDTVTLQKHGAGWQMVAPRKLPADDFLIKAFLDDLSKPTVSHFTPANIKLASYGLADPQLRLHLNGTEIDFGNTEPLRGNRYVKVGDTVFLTTGVLFYRLNRDPLWWVSKQLLPSGARITALQLPDASLTLKAGKWQLSPADPRVSADAIQRLIDAWRDARAMSVLAPEAGKSAGEVAIQLAGQSQPLRFNILDKSDFLILVRPDLKLEYRFQREEHDSLLSLSHTPAKKSGAGHNGVKETPDARTAGSRDHSPGD